MSRVCIVFDRLRAEEKMLKKEASDMGHDISMMDAKTATLDTGSVRDDRFGDVVLERCISYFRGLHFTSCLEFMDVPVLNRFDVANTCGNKMFMTLRLKKAGVPTPDTHFAFSGEGAVTCVEDAGCPLVIKPVVGSWGRGVVPIRDRDALDAMIEIRGVSDGPYDRTYYLQELINRPPRDIRVITVGDEPIAAMYRESSGGFKTNLALGGSRHPVSCEITGEIGDLAARASRAVGGGILGVDMMEDEASGLTVHEVNNTVEFKGLASVSRRNIPGAIVQFAIDHVRK